MGENEKEKSFGQSLLFEEIPLPSPHQTSNLYSVSLLFCMVFVVWMLKVQE